jgi:GPI mannosyltransferase 3
MLDWTSGTFTSATRTMMMKSVVIFLAFSIFRVLNVLLIQSQFDPDEYWQQLEPAYCHVFASSSGERCPGLTWEWKRRPRRTDFVNLEEFVSIGLQGPVRSYASILPTLFFYHIIKYVGVDSSWMVARGPVILNAILVAASTDWCVWYLSGFLCPPKHDSLLSIRKWCVYGSISSWFMGYALIRTYSNSLETVLLALSLALVAPELLGDASKVQNRISILRACLAFLLGGLSCSIRFTSLAAFVPMGIILSVSGSRSLISTMIYLLIVCAISGFVGVALTLVLDRHMYGFPAVPFLGNIQFNVVEGEFGRLSQRIFQSSHITHASFPR